MWALCYCVCSMQLAHLAHVTPCLLLVTATLLLVSPWLLLIHRQCYLLLTLTQGLGCGWGCAARLDTKTWHIALRRQQQACDRHVICPM